jgi:hypothetical protein
MRTAAQERQLDEARKNVSSPSARAKLSASLKRRHRENPELMRRGIAAMQSPEARKKAADALRRPVEQRFEEKVSPEPNSGCWLWIGSADRLGYGQLRVEGRAVLATHVSLELAGRPRPWPTACARHKCDNPNCVNPDHLEWGTLSDNAQDSLKRGRANLSGLAFGHAAMRASYESRAIKPCDHCGIDYRATWAQIRRNRNFFCSSTCSVAWQKATYTGRAIKSWSAAA